jgi:hypothetical protein
MVVSDSRIMSTKMCINYLAAVNAKHGPLYIAIISGTRGKGFTPAKQYKASVLEARGGSMPHSGPCSCALATASCPRATAAAKPALHCVQLGPCKHQ